MERYSKPSSSKRQSRYSEDFKQFICNEHLRGGHSLTSLRIRYNIGGKMTISRWLKTLGYLTPKLVSSCGMASEELKSSNPDKSRSELEQELQEAKLLAAAYKKMIELAEQEFKIKIIKKSNTK